MPFSMERLFGLVDDRDLPSHANDRQSPTEQQSPQERQEKLEMPGSSNIAQDSTTERSQPS